MKIIDRDGDFNFVLVPIALGSLVLAGGVVGLVRNPQRNLAVDIPVILAVATILLLPGVLMLREQIREDRFRAWLVQNHAALYGGGASYHGITLTAASQLHRFAYFYGVVLLHVRGLGRPLVLGVDSLPRCRRVYDLVTLTWGWWHLVGPFLTVATVYRNHKKPQTITVAEYMHQVGRQGPSLGGATNPF